MKYVQPPCERSPSGSERGLKLTRKNCYNVEQLWVAKQTIRKKCRIMQEVLEKDDNSIIITSMLVYML